MARNPTFPIYDQLLDGRLPDLLRSLVDRGLSVPDIRDELRDFHRVDVSDSTVRRWIRNLERADRAS